MAASEGRIKSIMSVRAIALYFPQFHPIPENDQWWGRGFSEWRNVVRAQPLFLGHYQPHLPADLGFYDLRVAETRLAQAELAAAYGIHGFCYYHYWFQGRRLLDRPFREVLQSGQPNFPFCLCWANENWTRVWDGQSQHVLLQQTYSDEDDLNHLRWLATAFRDARYIRIDGKPLFLVYRALQLPSASRTTALWRDEARKLGLGELFLCRVESFPEERGDPKALGFDAAVEFQPDWSTLDDLPTVRSPNRRYRDREDRIYDYAAVVERMLRREAPSYRRLPCAMPSWDNTSRRKREAVILHGASPALYERWLDGALRQSFQGLSEERIVFINAWNEWGEGNHLEPDQRFGRGYLEATKRVLDFHVSRR
jgi:lipopolysaccharide biosynthesis protein